MCTAYQPAAMLLERFEMFAIMKFSCVEIILNRQAKI